ncbi:unnamed protein product [Adineta ricciae]|uniref:Carboxymethylenebutenolidase homolog n=1 Tax=Adineta ricciae TaxID=249248 RepID=A0A815KPB5_ADIRI|nr:unnamed protein product [Adineta ricciae]
MHFLSTFLICAGYLVDHSINGLLWNETYLKGDLVQVGDLNVYSVGKSTLSFAVIVIYDVRGFNVSQTRVFCDRLASEYSTRVVMPDFFRGGAAPPSGNLSAWVSVAGNWSRVSNDLTSIASWLQKNDSTTRIGLIGFCWGGLQVVRACSNLSSLFFAGVSIHGSSITVTEVGLLKKPMFFIASGTDPALRPNISDAIEQANPLISKQCQYKTYDNMVHGFASARANFSNPANVAAIDDVHLNVINYFTKVLNNPAPFLSMNSQLIFLFVFVSLIFT